MKRKTGIYDEIYCRKWRLICIALIFIFSVISISATGAESSTDRQASDRIVHESNIRVSNETEDNYCSYCTESGKENGNGYGYSYCTENEDEDNTDNACSYCMESKEKSLEQKVGKTKSTETQKTVVENNKSQTGTGKNTKTQKTVVENNKSQTGTGKNTTIQKTVAEGNKSQTGTGKNTKTQKTVAEDNKSKTGTGKNTKTQKTVEEDNKSKTGTGENTKTQKTVVEDNKSKTGTGENTTTQKTVKENNKSQTGIGKNTKTQKTVEDTEQETYLYNSILYFKVHKIGENETTETQETVEEDNESETGTGKNTKTQKTVEEDNESKTGTGKNTTTQKTVEEDNESKTGTGKNTTIQETVVEDNESEIGTGKNTTIQETVVEDNESETGTGKNTTTQKTVEEDNESKTGTGKNTTIQETVEEDNESKTGTGKNTTIQETVEEDNESEIGTGKNTTIQETVVEDNESETGTGENTKTQKTIEEDNESQTGTGKKATTQKTVEDTEQEIYLYDSLLNSKMYRMGGNKTTETQEIVEEDNESQTGIGKNTTTQKMVEEDNESETETGENTTIQKTNVKESDSNSSESDGSNWKSRIKIVNRTATQKSAGTKNETKTEVSNGSKSLISAGVETKTGTKTCNGTCNGTNSVGSKMVKPEVIVYNWTNNLGSQEVNTEIKVYNWTDSQGNKSVPPEIKTEKNSWNNMKFILSYSYPLRPFYAVNDSLNLSYNGPDALGQQNVDIYLIKENSQSSPENEISYGMNESTISLEDVLNNNTEAYIQIPATLNKEGDLTPLTLGPLQAGSYQILITLAGNETEEPESEKDILFAKHFEVLKYQLEASAPYALREGENLEVNLDLKNASAEENGTYWAVLIKDSAYTASEGTNPSWRMITGIRPIVNGVDLIKSLETSLNGYESENEKDEIKNEIQTLIGEDNGTISIGEENQSNLSMKTLELPPGDYLLLTGAYGNKESLEGIDQKKLRISAENLHGLGLESSSGNTLGSTSSMKFKASPLEDIKPYIQANSLVEVLRNPPKLPSFLLGFAITLLIGLAVLRKKK